jgi:hypothetical protein
MENFLEMLSQETMAASALFEKAAQVEKLQILRGNIPKVETLFQVIGVLDASLLVNHFLEEEEYEDFDSEKRPEPALLNLSLFWLGLVYRDLENSKASFHTFKWVAKRMVKSNQGRANPLEPFQETLLLKILVGLCISAAHFKSWETAIDTGLKLITIFESKISNGVDLDLQEYFSILMIVAEAGKAFHEESCSAFAFRKALELFEMEKRLPENSLLVIISNFMPSELKGSSHCKELVQLNLCLQLVYSNENANGDSFLSLKYARSALEHYLLSEDNSNSMIQEQELLFLQGRMLYKSALSLAGKSRKSNP